MLFLDRKLDFFDLPTRCQPPCDHPQKRVTQAFSWAFCASYIDILQGIGYYVAIMADTPPALAAVRHLQPYIDQLGLDPLFITALLQVEAPKGGFLPGGHPTILYERHRFHRLTGGRFSDEHPDLSNPTPSWADHSYGTRSEQVVRLARASLLDCDAAHQACSWGGLQILGENHRQAGFDTVWSFVAAMHRDEASQLAVALAFLESKPSMLAAARRLEIDRFSRLWNGPAYRKTGHHRKLRLALDELRNPTTTGGS